MSLFMQRAYEEALKANELDEVPVGAILVYQGQIIASAHNLKETLQEVSAHAEILVLKEAAQKLKSWRLIDCELYVTLEPCPMCLAACQQARIQKLVYGSKDSKGGAIELGFNLHQNPRLNHQFEVQYEPSDECSLILKNFFQQKRKST